MGLMKKKKKKKKKKPRIEGQNVLMDNLFLLI